MSHDRTTVQWNKIKWSRPNKIESKKQGAKAVTQTTFPDDLTPLNRDKQSKQ